MRLNLLITIICCVTTLNAQNLIPNPSFEKSIPMPFNSKPSPLFRTFSQAQFNKNANGIITVYNSTPDFITSDNHGMQFSDFGEYIVTDFKAKSGKMSMGIRIWGCKASDVCCREVIQIPLLQPMKTGKKYYLEFWAARMEGSMAIPLSVFWGDTAMIENPMSAGFHVNPQIRTKTLIGKIPFVWEKISDTIEAKSNYKFMSIGNFIVGDDNTPNLAIEQDRTYPRAYYFIDDITLRPLDGYDENLIEKNKPNFTLNDVNFNTDESRLLPRVFAILDSIFTIFKKSPTDTILLVGHTDNVGTTEHNLQLSLNRALSIKNYLIKKGIPTAQINIIGKGESEPIDSNNSEKGRKLNRRVEFFIIPKS